MHDERAVGCAEGEVCCYGKCGIRPFFPLLGSPTGECIFKSDTCPSFNSADLNQNRKRPLGTDCSFLPHTPEGYDCCTVTA